MFGLIVSDPACNAARRCELSALLYSLDIPLSAFTEASATMFSESMPRATFLRTASCALLQPGQPLPLDGLLTHLATSDPLSANVLRRYLFLQLSLLPYLRPGCSITQQDGFFLLGEQLLVAPVTPEDTVDIQLPSGIWTELNGNCHEGRLRCMRGYNEMPVLARDNALIPIGVNDRTTTHDDADRLTLHWFQPKDSSACILADGTKYQASRSGDHFRVETDTPETFHLIVHQNGAETLIR